MTTTETPARSWALALDTVLGASGADGRLVVTFRPTVATGEMHAGVEWGVVYYRGTTKRAAVKVAAMGTGELKAAADSNSEIKRRDARSALLDDAIAKALDRAPGDNKTRQIVLYIEGRLDGGGIPY